VIVFGNIFLAFGLLMLIINSFTLLSLNDTGRGSGYGNHSVGGHGLELWKEPPFQWSFAALEDRISCTVLCSVCNLRTKSALQECYQSALQECYVGIRGVVGLTPSTMQNYSSRACALLSLFPP
jgi:hypothetical protein